MKAQKYNTKQNKETIKELSIRYPVEENNMHSTSKEGDAMPGCTQIDGVTHWHNVKIRHDSGKIVIYSDEDGEEKIYSVQDYDCDDCKYKKWIKNKKESKRREIKESILDTIFRALTGSFLIIVFLTVNALGLLLFSMLFSFFS